MYFMILAEDWHTVEYYNLKNTVYEKDYSYPDVWKQKRKFRII